MTRASREKILETTCDLLENQGFHATGLNEIVRESGAPKGSIYYYFPNGKEEIIIEAIRYASQRMLASVRAHLEGIADPAQAVASLLNQIAYHVEASGFRAGGPLTIVASESATTSAGINRACHEAYDALAAIFAEKICQAGIEAAPAAALALTVTATVEGAIILSRTYHTGDPLRQAAAHLEMLLRQQLTTRRL